jgi:UDP-2,3-diacylglucosamine pyrophosphatase LpxH
MDQKPVTLIVSDLHIGDGSPADDFVNDRDQFATFLRTQAATPDGQAGKIELIINGDFLEFVQVLPKAYTLNSTEYWCSEAESLAKLDCILAGHPEIFKALEAFQAQGSRVTLFPGNHDIDLYWGAVQDRLRLHFPGVNIETGAVTNTRYADRLHISHGHLFPSIDPANNFWKWGNPILSLPRDADPKRLEMCPGTLFVVRFVNSLEARYPFADNLHPEMALAGILAREDRWGLAVVAWSLLHFAKAYPRAFLSADHRTPETGARVLNAIQGDRFVLEKIAFLYAKVMNQPDATPAMIRQAFDSEDAIAAFVEQLMRADESWDTWLDVLDTTKPAVSAIGGGTDTLSIIESGNIDNRSECLTIARRRWNAGAQIVVLGHTHLPQSVNEDGHAYYNPGSWTRYVDDPKRLTLEDLQDESRFPYKLHYIRVEDTGAPILTSEMGCLEEVRPER